MGTLIRRSLVLLTLLLLMSSASAQAADCEFRLGFKTLRDLIGHDIVGECLENEHYNAIGDSNQQTTGGLMAWRKADNWTAFTDGYRTWINGPDGLVMRLNTTRFEWEADYAEIVLGIRPTPTPVPPTPVPAPPPPPPWPGVSTVPVGVAHAFEHDGETWEITVLEVVRGQALQDRIARSDNWFADSYKPPSPGQEHVAVKVRIKLLANKDLGSTGGILGYGTCLDSWCIDFAILSALHVAMESGGMGRPEFYAGYVLGGNALDSTPFIYIGGSETGWFSWTIWSGQRVVMIVKMDDDQNELSEYTVVFAL